MSLFDDIRTGLEQAIAYEQGVGSARTTTMSVIPVNNYDADEVKIIRKSTGLTQSVFARYMGVSVKTVEAWESGRNHPSGAACRLLAVTKNNPNFPIESGIITR